MSNAARLLVVLVLVGAVVGQGAASADSAAITVQPVSGPPTTAVQVTGTGFGSNEAVAVSFGTKALATATADQAGAFSATIHVPRSASAGDHQVTAAGQASSLSATATFTVVLPTIALSLAVGAPTAPLTVSSANFRGLEKVEVIFDSTTLATPTADQSGAFSATVHVPVRARSGSHLVTATGRASKLKAGSAFLVRIVDWPQLGFEPAHSGHNPAEALLDPSTVGDLARAWHTGIKLGFAAAFSSPAVVKGVVYVGSEHGKVYALDAWTGAVKWITKVGPGHAWSSPAVAGGVVYIGADALFALRASTGKLLWTLRDRTADYQSPTVANGVVYVAAGNDGWALLYAVRASDGSILWRTKAWDTGVLGIGMAPTVADGVVFTGSKSKKLYALDAATGKIRWTIPLGEEVGTPPAVVNGTVYVPTDRHLRAIRVSTGEVLWTAPVEGGGWSSPAVDDGVVYVAGGEGVYAFDAATGDRVWSGPAWATGSSPAVANGVVYVNATEDNERPVGSLYALDAKTGQLLWRAPIRSEGLADPRVVNGTVYAGSTHGGVYAFSLP